uniref:Uncharacterized protein n=1 Tax=Sipha flava TaxID=143950 RepID=A0A2S2R7G0_9HEMI
MLRFLRIVALTVFEMDQRWISTNANGNRRGGTARHGLRDGTERKNCLCRRFSITTIIVSIIFISIISTCTPRVAFNDRFRLDRLVGRQTTHNQYREAIIAFIWMGCFEPHPRIHRPGAFRLPFVHFPEEAHGWKTIFN